MSAADNEKRIVFHAIEEALRAFGLLYGREHKLSELAAGAADENAAIHAYLVNERPHLLQSYRIDTLVQLVRAAMDNGQGHTPGLEQFMPKP